MAVIYTIRVPSGGSIEHIADYLRHVADQVEDGCISGHVDADTHWEAAEEHEASQTGPPTAAAWIEANT